MNTLNSTETKLAPFLLNFVHLIILRCRQTNAIFENSFLFIADIQFHIRSSNSHDRT